MRIKDAIEDRIIGVAVSSILILICLIIMYPLIFMVTASISDPFTVASGQIWLFPKGITFDAYSRVFKNPDIMMGYGNTIIYTVVGTLINVFLTMLTAYPLTRKDLKYRNILSAVFAFTMLFGGGMIPTYLIIKNVGLLNTIWAMLIPGAISVWNLIIARTYIQSNIPWELQESAFLDGCGNFRLLIRIITPLCMPIVAVLTLYYAVAHWNNYFSAMMYITNKKLYPLQLILREILIQNDTGSMMDSGSETMAKQSFLGETLKYAVIIVSSVPVLMLYPFLQKYFVKGVMVGAVKG